MKEFETAMIGFSKSSSVIPVARHRALAPAMLRPWVVVELRSSGMGQRLVGHLANSEFDIEDRRRLPAAYWRLIDDSDA